jgi:hypothetical protein
MKESNKLDIVELREAIEELNGDLRRTVRNFEEQFPLLYVDNIIVSHPCNMISVDPYVKPLTYVKAKISLR